MSHVIDAMRELQKGHPGHLQHQKRGDPVLEDLGKALLTHDNQAQLLSPGHTWTGLGRHPESRAIVLLCRQLPSRPC